jgi:hypothetical protein
VAGFMRTGSASGEASAVEFMSLIAKEVGQWSFVPTTTRV